MASLMETIQFMADFDLADYYTRLNNELEAHEAAGAMKCVCQCNEICNPHSMARDEIVSRWLYEQEPGPE